MKKNPMDQYFKANFKMADESGQDRVFRIPHIFQNILMHLEITDWESCENVCQQWRDFVLGLYSKASLRYVIKKVYFKLGKYHFKKY